MQTRSQRIAPRQRLVALAAQHVDALGRVDLQRPAHAFQIALERGMAGMARLDLIDAGRAQAGQQRRPFGVQRGQFALQRGQVLAARLDAQPAHAGQFQLRRRRQQQLPVDLQFAAVQQRPRARLQSVRQPRGHGLQLGAQAGPLAFDPAQSLQIGVRHFDANHLGLERRSLGNQFIRRFQRAIQALRVGVQLAQLLFQVAPIGLRLRRRQGQPRRVGGGALRVALLQRARQRRSDWRRRSAAACACCSSVRSSASSCWSRPT